MTKQTPLSGWGNYPTSSSFVERPERSHDLVVPEGKAIARGLGRSYGDAALNDGQNVILMERLNRFVSFDENTGILHAEAGASLAEIIEVFLPRGWFLPVTPGTKEATLGGCFACDVHGKNHHADGSFSRHVTEIELLLADGSRRRCSPSQNTDLFWASAGGLGLTGIITEVALQLIPVKTAYIRARNYSADNLRGVLNILNDASREDKYSVAWIDGCTKGKGFGRGIVMYGRHAELSDLNSKATDPLRIKPKKTVSVPFKAPSWTLNSWNVMIFNMLYHKMQARKSSTFLVDSDRYFYPLDSLSNWNHLYGKRGFVQYQFAVPMANSENAISSVFREMVRENRSSFLAVVKRFGPASQGLLSFPIEGFTLAMDFPVSDPGLFDFLNRLDEIVIQNSGKVYLAKDARLKPEYFKIMYPRFPDWQNIKSKIDPEWKFSSDLSRRLKMEAAS